RQYLAERMPFVQSAFQIDVWLELPLEEARRWLAWWRVGLEAEGAGTRLRCGRDQLEMFAAHLLSLECRIVVHAPGELRATFQRFAARAEAAAAAAGGS
ncbi:MAG: helix-turn-helix transcriptional regulator, partial [Terriglobales bacterium]